MSKTSSSVTAHKIYLILLRRSKAFHQRQKRFEILQHIKNSEEGRVPLTTPLYHGGGMNLRVRPRVDIERKLGHRYTTSTRRRTNFWHETALTVPKFRRLAGSKFFIKRTFWMVPYEWSGRWNLSVAVEDFALCLEELAWNYNSSSLNVCFRIVSFEVVKEN